MFRELEMFITYYIQNLLDTIPLEDYLYKKLTYIISAKKKIHTKINGSQVVLKMTTMFLIRI